MELRIVESEVIFKFFREDPALCLKALPDNTLNQLYHTGTFVDGEDSFYAGIFENDEMIGVFNWSLFTPEAVAIHLFLATRFHKTSKVFKVFRFLRKHLLEKTEFIKVIIMTPSVCHHVVRAVENFGFEKEGVLKNSIKWRGEVVDFLFYGYTLDRTTSDNEV